MRKHRTDVLLRMLAAAALAAVTLLVAACGGDGSTANEGNDDQAASSSEPIEVAFFTSLGNTYLEATFDGLKKGFEGSDVNLTPFDSQFDPQKQYSQIQDAIVASKYDAFVIFPVDGNAIIPLVRQAADAGIHVIDTDYPIGPGFDTSEPQVEGVDGAVLVPATRFGDALGELTVEACEDRSPCKVAMLPGFLKSPFDNAVMESIESIVGESGDISIVAKQEGELLAAPALGVVQNVLQAHPDLDVVTAIGDQMAVGAERAIKSAGKADDVEIIGASASEIGVKAVREGRWFGTSISLPFTEGEVGAEMVLQAIEGEVDPSGVNPVERLGLPGYISQENLDEFPEDFTGQWKG